MNNCPQCGAEIIGRYHFCLECGAPLELAKALTPAPQVASPPPEAKEDNAQPAPQKEEVESPSAANLSVVDRGERQHLTPAPFSLMPEEEIPSAPVSSQRERAATPSPSSSIEYLDLTLIRSPDLDSVRFVVKDHSIIGRSEGHLVFKDDPFISPKHATLFYRDGELILRDENSLNGVYIRISEPTVVELNECFIAGEQVYFISDQLDPLSELPPEDEAEFFANSVKQSDRFKLVQLLEGDAHGAIHPFIESSITIGRQGCDVNAPLDRYMSSRHCHLSLIGDEVTLTDRGSKNGTYVKIKGERRLQVGDYILIGKQLLQVQPHQPGSRSKVAI